VVVGAAGKVELAEDAVRGLLHGCLGDPPAPALDCRNDLDYRDDRVAVVVIMT